MITNDYNSKSVLYNQCDSLTYIQAYKKELTL
jgi:hypothetical protein